MKKQYCVVKYVLAETQSEAVRKSKSISISEVYIHHQWLEKNVNYNMFNSKNSKIGFKNNG